MSDLTDEKHWSLSALLLFLLLPCMCVTILFHLKSYIVIEHSSVVNDFFGSFQIVLEINYILNIIIRHRHHLHFCSIFGEGERMCSVIVVRRYKCIPISVKGEIQSYREEGFMQVCGAATEREMHVIADSLTPLRKAPYKLRCNCEHCVSYSFEHVTQNIVVEPLMRAVNMIFNSLCQYGYLLQTSTVAQNLDGSSTTTWVWTRQIKSFR